MEGVGARLGRSSTRYGPTTVFTGPVRKWKKKWIHVVAANGGGASANHHASQINGNNGSSSHLVLYKWTPISQTQNNNNGDNGSINRSSLSKEDEVVGAAEEPPKKKFRYVPEERKAAAQLRWHASQLDKFKMAVLEEKKNEDVEKAEDEAKPSETDPPGGATSAKDSSDGKPDMNDVPMDEAEASENDQPATQDLNETSLDLSLGLKGPDGEQDSNPKTED
ncbi:hypothetical protein Syun_009812 [Stephania yunnanensis]|uniref:Uncharacterized protein n=1 Tax=Stephania yunnanensis TaxID=152371 RepID=A0AAP0KGV5_9MAGN